MSKLELFRNLLDEMGKKYSDEKNKNENIKIFKDHFKYIGTGNPNADILIIGKETSIDDYSQKEREIFGNLVQWKGIVAQKDFDQSAIKERDWRNYSPLYPYKGQILKIDNKKGNNGTSRTWLNYQKLYNKICGNDNQGKINFHENVFITEVNSNPSPKTKNADTSSINFRKMIFKESDFFQSFPVIIIAGYGYFEIKNDFNQIEDVFKVKYFEGKLAAGKNTQKYWVHWSEGRKKLLINTKQLSMYVSDALLDEIAQEIRESGLLKQM